MNKMKNKNATLQNKAKCDIAISEPNGGHANVRGLSTLASETRGITLIALVITIIVLLILAGVAVSIGLNGDNVFERANEAKTSWNTKVSEEEDAIWNALNYIGMERPVTIEPDGDNPTEPTILTANADGAVVADGGADVTSEVAGYEYSLDKITWTKTIPKGTGYKIGEEIAGDTPAWSTTNVVNTVTEGTKKAPIPMGFTASSVATSGAEENLISKGLVIYENKKQDGTADASAITTETQETAMTTRDQYVWIPVDDINDMVMCTGNGTQKAVTVWVRTVDTTGNKSEPTELSTTVTKTLCNIVFDKSGNLRCSVHMKDEGNTHFLCGRSYETNSTTTDTSTPKTYTTSMTFDSTAKASQTYSANSGYREPAVVTGDSSGTGSSYDGSSSYSIKNESGTSIAGGNNGSNILAELKRQFNNMAKSVATYGGFYIARYEVGYDATSCTSKKGQVVMNAGTTANKGANMWYGLYNHIIGTKGGTTSQMIWGSEYDQVIKFIGSEAQTGHTDRNLPGTNGSSDYRNSGATPLDKMKNIYDLEGNYYEWTAQAYNTLSRANRGGGRSDVSKGGFYPASIRSDNISNLPSDLISSRQSLYVSL